MPVVVRMRLQHSCSDLLTPVTDFLVFALCLVRRCYSCSSGVDLECGDAPAVHNLTDIPKWTVPCESFADFLTYTHHHRYRGDDDIDDFIQEPDWWNFTSAYIVTCKKVINKLIARDPPLTPWMKR